jgi:hypothetical protein
MDLGNDPAKAAARQSGREQENRIWLRRQCLRRRDRATTLRHPAEQTAITA